MAITNAQQYQQLVNKRADGKRPGYRGDAAAQAGAPGMAAPGPGADPGDGPKSGQSQADRNRELAESRASIAARMAATQAAAEEAARQKALEDIRKQTIIGTNKLTPNYFDRAVNKAKTLNTNIRNKLISGFIDRTVYDNLYNAGIYGEDETDLLGMGIPSLTGIATRALRTMNPPADVKAMDVDSIRELGLTGQIPSDMSKSQLSAMQDVRRNLENKAELESQGMTQSRFEELYPSTVMTNEDRGDGGQTYIPPVLTPYQEDVVEEEVDPNSLQGLLANRIAYRFMADGGRAGFQQGSPAPIAPKVDPRMAKSLQENIATNEAQRTANVTRKEAQRKAIEDIRNAISSGGKEGLGSFLKQQFGVANPSQVPGYSSYDSPLTGVSSFAKDRITNALIQNYLNPSAQGSGTYGSGNAINPYASMFVQTPGGMFGNPNPYDVSSAVQSGYGVMLDGNLYKSEQDAIDALGIERYNQLMADGGRAGFMDGGMSEDNFIGGLADGNLDEMGRQMYGLGKLVKKATRAVKKIVKSPVGKAALLAGGAGLFGFGPAKGLFASGKGLAFKEMLAKGILKKGATDFTLANLSPFKTIGLASLASGLMSQPEEDEEEETYYRGPGLDIAAIRRDPYAARGAAYGFYAEGGDVKEPVAKDTMPLLDMNGMEKDYRADGGFVPIGRMERADDVPARLSKNEFVFTADAVRNAGDGDVDKGAEVMYNMMKNLESGGKVSEESQGLDGARDMFQTSKRLEEVL